MKKILFVCTGNTCRSPMAECLFNHLAQEQGLPYCAESAGIYANAGSPASDGAHAAMKSRGLSLLRHQAQPLSEALLKEAFLVVAMTPNHAEACKERFPALSTPIRSFSPPIPDPFGGSTAVYQYTAQALETQIIPLLKELVPPPTLANP